MNENDAKTALIKKSQLNPLKLRELQARYDALHFCPSS